MCQLKNASQLKKGHSWKDRSQLRHILKHVSQLIRRSQLKKMFHSLENKLQLRKCVTVEKSVTLKKCLIVEKWVRIKTYFGSHLKNRTQSKKIGLTKKMCHI